MYFILTLVINLFMLYKLILKPSRYRDGLRVGRPRILCSIPGRGKGFYFLYIVNTSSGTHPTSYLLSTSGSVSVVEAERCEADSSPPPNAVVKRGVGISHLPICLLGVVLN